MHTFSETGTGVPAFLAKLWRLVDDPETNNLICWSKDGRSFIIQNQAQFARELLPLNYKHNNMASFIRQLNMYGFHKITSIDNGGLKFDKDEMEFSHPCFKRNCAYLLEHIKRKIANTKNVNEDKSAIKSEAVTKVLQDVKAMRGRQDSLDSRFSVMKQENEALWREIASLRQKHAKQQQIVNKLIQFLITIVQPSRNMSGVKRHMQLMINDTPDNVKECKISESNLESGPVIHELGEDLLDEVEDTENELIDRNSPYIKSINDFQENDNVSPLNAERPQSTLSNVSQHYDFSNLSADDVYNVPMVSGNLDSSGSVIESVNPDGSQVIYHVTELPDLNPPETHDAVINEENVLNTPMVREQIARTQLLKQKNKQRRKQNVTKEAMLPSTSAKSIKLQNNNQLQQKQQQKQQQQLKITIPATEVKSELNIDPIEFLNAYPENQSSTKPLLTSPTTNENPIESTSANAAISGRTSDLYIPNDFIPNEIPADIFEDSLTAGDDFCNDQKQYVLPVSGNFSSFLVGSNSSNGASTSAAAAAAALNSSGSQSAQSENGNNNESKQDKNGSKMAVAKYKSGKSGSDDFMRDEVHGHLENVQDELDTLRDLLRSDSYSLDANTLMGNGSTMQINNQLLSKARDGDFLQKLFNDADIMNSYGLSLNVDPTNDNKKGSELMTYQPFYDFSDIMDMNDKDEINATDDAANPPSSSSRQPQGQDSVLNTPYHE